MRLDGCGIYEKPAPVGRARAKSCILGDDSGDGALRYDRRQAASVDNNQVFGSVKLLLMGDHYPASPIVTALAPPAKKHPRWGATRVSLSGYILVWMVVR
jgi:hypothetical protein